MFDLAKCLLLRFETVTCGTRVSGKRKMDRADREEEGGGRRREEEGGKGRRREEEEEEEEAGEIGEARGGIGERKG